MAVSSEAKTAPRAGPVPLRAGPEPETASLLGVENRILVAGFFITLAFSYTQVPLFYAIRHMQCHTFYDARPAYSGSGDRCGVAEITAATATQFTIFNMSTTLCGILNLFVARWEVQRFGPRAALLAQIFVPTLRVATQIPGILIGKGAGIAILQASQLITILGGPAGYVFVINVMAGGLVEPARRTAIFGKLQGCIMLGEGIGFLAGGVAGNALGIRAPFIIALASFLVAGLYSRLAMPCMTPESVSDHGRASSTPLTPFRVLLPQRLRLLDGRETKHRGVLFLCGGVFLGALATGYAPSLIQMYAAADFDFNQADNGWLTSEFAFMRGLVLIFIFPRIIARGRAWFASPPRRDAADETSASLLPSSCEAPLPSDDDDDDDDDDDLAGLEKLGPDRRARLFDLVFLRWSLVVDAALTTLAAFSTRRWHVYLAALVLPFGSGSAPTAKGIIMDMCGPSRQADALHTITLVEQAAKLAAQGLFGVVFASLAEEREAYATFFCNAAVAVAAMGVLLFSSFPPSHSTPIDDPDYDEGYVAVHVEEQEWSAKAGVEREDDV